jgi:flavin-binding protein dodecin
MRSSMTVARVTEIAPVRRRRFEDAVRGSPEAPRRTRNVRGTGSGQRVDISDGKITEYQVNLMVTFVLDD